MHILDEVGGDFDSPREAVVPIDYIADMVSELPSVTPTPKMGRWISNAEDDLKISEYTCSNCKGLSDEDSDFCPKCGAKMVEPQESEDKEE